MGNSLAGSSDTSSGTGGASGGTNGSFPIADLFLRPQAPADQFGSPPPVQPASSQASVAPASTATATQLATAAALWGQPIPELFGTCQVLGYPIWTGTPAYQADASNGSNLVVDFAVVFGRCGPRSAGANIRNLYFDGVAFLAQDPSTDQLVQNVDFTYTFYDGAQTADQIDPTIQAAQGDQTPAFLGMVYLVVNGYVATGTNFPQVVAELHMDEIAYPTGARISPFGINNNIGHTSYANALWWNSDQSVLYLLYKSGTRYILDIWDSNANSFLAKVPLADSNTLDVGVLNIVGTLDGSYMMMCNGYTHFRLYDPGNGHVASELDLSPYGVSLAVDWYPVDTPGGGQIILVGSYGRKLNVLTINGSRLANYAQIDVGALITYGAGPGDSCYAFARIRDYSALNVPQNFTITYFAAKGAICRYIKTAGGGDVPVGTAYLKADVGNATYSHQYTRGEGVEVMLQIGGDGPFQLYVGAKGERVWVLISTDGGSTKRVRCYQTFFGLYNNAISPSDAATLTLAELEAAGGFEYFQLLYDRPVDLPDAVYWPAGQITRPYQTTIAKGNALSISVINLNNGGGATHEYGDYVSLPKFGSFDYGSQNFPQNVLWDNIAHGFFYYGMSGGGFKDFPGRAFLPNNSTGTRPVYRLDFAFRDISLLAGYDDGEITTVGISALSDIVAGMCLNQSVNYTDLISQLAAAFRVNVVETPDFGIKFVKRSPGASPDFSVVPDDCIPSGNDGNGNLVAMGVLATNQLPTILQLSYVDPDQQYLVATQQAKRSVFPHPSAFVDLTVNISIPVVMSAEKAQYYVGFALYDMWAGKITLTVNLPPRYAIVEPGDYCTITLTTGRIITAQVAGQQINADRSVTLTLSASQINKFVPQKQITDHRP